MDRILFSSQKCWGFLTHRGSIRENAAQTDTKSSPSANPTNFNPSLWQVIDHSINLSHMRFDRYKSHPKYNSGGILIDLYNKSFTITCIGRENFKSSYEVARFLQTAKQFDRHTLSHCLQWCWTDHSMTQRPVGWNPDQVLTERRRHAIERCNDFMFPLF